MMMMMMMMMLMMIVCVEVQSMSVMAQWREHWTHSRVMWVQFPVNQHKSFVTSGTSSGENCSSHP